MPDVIAQRLMAPLLLHSFFYFQITFFTCFILKAYPADFFIFFPQSSNAPESLQNFLLLI